MEGIPSAESMSEQLPVRDRFYSHFQKMTGYLALHRKFASTILVAVTTHYIFARSLRFDLKPL